MPPYQRNTADMSDYICTYVRDVRADGGLCSRCTSGPIPTDEASVQEIEKGGGGKMEKKK